MNGTRKKLVLIPRAKGENEHKRNMYTKKRKKHKERKERKQRGEEEDNDEEKEDLVSRQNISLGLYDLSQVRRVRVTR